MMAVVIPMSLLLNIPNLEITYYAASSLDGYIAKEDSDVSWLDDLGISLDDTGYQEFFSTVDALVMGHNTYYLQVEYVITPD